MERIVSFCLFMLFMGCVVISDSEKRNSIATQGQITVFLNGPDASSVDISFFHGGIFIVNENGVHYQLDDRPSVAVRSLAMVNKQIMLGERMLPEGKYVKIVIKVKDAILKRNKRKSALGLPLTDIEIEREIQINKAKNETVFLFWDPDFSITEGFQFSPAFSVFDNAPELVRELLFVTNEDSNNVSFIDQRAEKVVATILVGRGPKGIAVNSIREMPRVYVANSRSNSISVIDPLNYRVESEIPIRFGWEPEGIATINKQDGSELILVCNYRSNNVSVIDAESYEEIDRFSVGSGPVNIEVDSQNDPFMVGRKLSAEDNLTWKRSREKWINVYVVNKNSKDISVVRMNLFNNRFEQFARISVDWNPVELTVDYQRGKVFVVNYGADSISVIDILQLINGNIGNPVSMICGVGLGSIDLAVDQMLDRIYLLRETPGELSIVKLGNERLSLVESTMSPRIGTIPVGKSPHSLLLNQELNKIFVANKGDNTVSVIEKMTRRISATIQVGQKPHQVAMFH